MIRRGSDRSQCSHCVGHNLAYRVGLVSECEFILIFNNSRAGKDTVFSEAILCSFFLCYRIAFVSRFRSYSFYLITPLISSSGWSGSQIRSILILLYNFFERLSENTYGLHSIKQSINNKAKVNNTQYK